jgi:hypothetical protein
MTPELIVVTLLPAAVAVLIAARLGLRHIRRRHGSADPALPPAGPAVGAIEVASDALRTSPRDETIPRVNVATAFRQVDESEFAWRMRVAEAERALAPGEVAAAPPATISRAMSKRPISPAYGARAASAAARRQALRGHASQAAIAGIAGAIAVVAVVLIPPWFQTGVVTATGSPSGPLAAVGSRPWSARPPAGPATPQAATASLPAVGPTPTEVSPPPHETGQGLDTSRRSNDAGVPTSTDTPPRRTPTPTDAPPRRPPPPEATPTASPRPVTQPPATPLPPTPRPPTPAPVTSPTPSPTHEPEEPVQVAFDWTSVGPAIKFHDRSRGAASRTWRFGDGTSSTERNPWHTFPRPGTYDVTLEIVGRDGSHHSMTRDVTVKP